MEFSRTMIRIYIVDKFACIDALNTENYDIIKYNEI